MNKLIRFILSSISALSIIILLKYTISFWIFEIIPEQKKHPADLLLTIMFLGIAAGLTGWIVSLVSARAAKYYTIPVL